MKKILQPGIWMAAMLLVTASAAQAATLSEADKARKREELNQFFSTAVVQAEPGAPKKARQQFRYTLNGSTRIGYDDNVDLDQIEDGDMFYQERVGGRVEYDPTGWEVGGKAVTLGTAASYNYMGYFSREDMNRQIGTVSPFVRFALGDRFMLETGYEFRGSHYDDQDEFNYFSNGARVELTHRLAPGLSHHGEFRYDVLGYTDRRMLNDNLTFGPEEDRNDEQYKALYGARYHVGRWTFRAEGSWKWNDSNDLYFNYSDYDDFGLDGSVSVRTTERWILTGFGGWHNRSYDDRPIGLNSTTVQDDDWYYVGGRIFFALNTWSGMDVTATYSENNSNRTTAEYGDFTTSAGFHLYF